MDKLIMFIVLALTAALSACAKADPGWIVGTEESAVRGGQPLYDDNSFAAVTVLLQITDPDGETSCTGSLIAKRVVLSAAHCLTAKNSRRLRTTGVRIVLGANPRKTNRDQERSIDVQEIKIHPRWRGIDLNGRGEKQFRGQVDLAILILTEDVPRGTSTVQLSVDSEDRFESGVVFVGYGPPDAKVDQLLHLRSGVAFIRRFAPQIRQWDLAVGRFAPSKKRTWPVPTIGDSGGPIFSPTLSSKAAALVQVGVLSTTDSFTPIAPHLDWVREQMRGAESEMIREARSR